MSGSGSAVFGLFSKGTGKSEIKKLKDQSFELVVLTHKTDAAITAQA